MFPSFAAVPCNRLLGFELVQRSAERVEVRCPVRPEMLQEAGIVQGGLITALADTAAVYLLWPDLPSDRTMTGLACAMQFLSPGQLHDGPLVAMATPLRIGKTIAVCDSVVTQGERLVARGTFTFLLQVQRAKENA